MKETILIAVFFAILIVKDIILYRRYKTMTARQDIHRNHISQLWIYLRDEEDKKYGGDK